MYILVYIFIHIVIYKHQSNLPKAMHEMLFSIENK